MKDSMKNWKVKAVIEKYDSNNNNLTETLILNNNRLLTVGIEALFLRLISNDSGRIFSSGTACIAVSDSTLNDSASSKNILGNTSSLSPSTLNLQNTTGSKSFYKTAILSASGNTLTATATFESGEANFEWKCWGISNKVPSSSDTSSTLIHLNRKIEAMGTKTSTSTWKFTVDISLT